MSAEDRPGSTLRSTAGLWLDAPAAPLDRGGPDRRYTGVLPHASGGMGDVFRAQDEVLGVPVALKLLAGPLSLRAGPVRAFMAEARLTASLSHPAIVPVHDIGIWPDGRPYYTMRWIEGPTLRDRVVRLHRSCQGGWAPDDEGMTLRRLLEALVGVCEAVAHAHARGVIHRDLKPTNIVLTGPGQPVVLDWGLAWSSAWAEAGLEARAACGTPGFAPPEQVRAAGAPRPTWDTWALGATLYEILRGARPYSSARLECVLDGPPPPVDQGATPPIDPGLAEITARALSWEPSARYPDATALAQALRGWLDGEARRARAREQVAAADARAHEVEKLRAAIQVARAPDSDEIEDRLASLPEPDLRARWEAEDWVGRQRQVVAASEGEVMERLRAALEHDPELSEAHLRLARAAQALHREAELRGDALEAARWAQTIRAHHRGTLDDYLIGDGWLDLETDPPGAEVLAARFEPELRRLVARPWGSLGRTPISGARLPLGSWLLTLRAPGRAEVRYPVLLTRQGRWPDPAHGGEARPVHLPAQGALGPDDVYVPAGPYRSYGDPLAPRPLPGRWRHVDGFVLRRDPVTVEEYLVFLNDLAARGPVDPLLEPRERAAHDRGERKVGWDGSRYLLDPGDGRSPWHPRQPVTYVRGDAARAYAAWVAAREGLPWRLPHSAWMEKAARGVDGRCYPMGDTLIAAWTWTQDNNPRPHGPCPVDQMRADESVYGVFGLSGNVGSWCDDPFESDRNRTAGGSWTWPVGYCRAAARMGHTPDTRLENVGIRLARPLPDRGGAG